MWPPASDPSEVPAAPALEPDDAASRWRRHLESWAIPTDILQAAPESPWGFQPGRFDKAAEAAVADPDSTPSRTSALERLPTGGSVLDVGVGGGAASLPLCPPAGQLVGVDESEAMLRSFGLAATRRRIRHEVFVGRWPDVAPAAPEADVVVCHHVVYNVADLVPFLRALTTHARRRVVVELTERHPLSGLAPLWRLIHGLERPIRPIASDAVEVASELGYDVQVASFQRSSPWDLASIEERVVDARRRLCVGSDRDAEIGAYLEAAGTGEPRRLVTMWWDPPERHGS